MWNKRYLWILIPIVLVIVGGGYFYYTTATASTGETEAPPIQTAVVREGDLTVFASGAGQVIPATEIGLGFDETGTLSEILVQIGDEVQEGQLLARLQTQETLESIAASVADAELNVVKTQQALDDIIENAEIEAASALKAVEEAQQAMEGLLSSNLEQAAAWQAVVEAEDTVEDAQRDIYISQSTAGQSDIDAAYAQMLLAAEALEKAEENFAKYVNKPEDNLARANAQANLSASQQDYDEAVRNYNAMTSTMNETSQAIASAEMDTAQAQLADAQREWERVKDGPSAGDIALAEANLNAAQAEWEVLIDGPDPEEVSLAEAELTNAKAKLDLALEAQAVLDLVAPIDGTVLAVDANVGEYVGTSSIITVADLDQPMLEVYLDETDLDKVAVGFAAEVVFDTFPDEMFIGQIVQVDPSLIDISGVQAVRTLLSLDADSFAKLQTLPVGLNASVDVIGGRAESAILIPVEALQELGPDEYAVFVIEDGEPKLRVVEIGLVDFTSAEILSGLEAGEIVTTGIVETESK